MEKMKRVEADQHIEVSFADLLAKNPKLDKLTLFSSLQDLIADCNEKVEKNSITVRLLEDEDVYDMKDFSTIAALKRHRPPEERCLHTRVMTKAGMLRVSLDDDCATPAVQSIIMGEIRRHLDECLDALTCKDSSK
ncbi:Hypothetical protein GLP15_2864 [Giardia lamblia P15]|uniref:Uncharacterized protein n=1 Tax=Giardia intestinalis (strain P15) TaxID=658858 RepID=E1F1X0_GIAIA|nr:Hypothetical protein GLP15_2864 [Giardia lamblia P15]